jgi:hypothetical protein
MKSEKEIIIDFIGDGETFTDLFIAQEYIEESLERYDELIQYFNQNKPNEDATEAFLKCADAMVRSLRALIDDITDAREMSEECEPR